MLTGGFSLAVAGFSEAAPVFPTVISPRLSSASFPELKHRNHLLAIFHMLVEGRCDPWETRHLDATHHPLHLLGDLVAPQVVVEGPVGPVAAVVGDRIGPLSIHFGNHGFFFFLLESKTERSLKSFWMMRLGLKAGF